jgi:hypothetical protein
MAEHRTHGMALTTPTCCGSYVLAERNTTPYLSSDKSIGLAVAHISSFILPPSTSANDRQSCISIITTASPPQQSDIPLFLFHSSLLI